MSFTFCHKVHAIQQHKQRVQLNQQPKQQSWNVTEVNLLDSLAVHTSDGLVTCTRQHGEAALKQRKLYMTTAEPSRLNGCEHETSLKQHGGRTETAEMKLMRSLPEHARL